VLQEVEREQGLEPIAKIIEKGTKVEVEKLNKEEKDFIKEHGEGAFSKKYQKCPMCGEKLENSGGCVICRECSLSRCD
jgi:ribonucleoside-diphosphate reductase alpha chain